MTISVIRLRRSVPLKYWLTRRLEVRRGADIEHLARRSAEQVPRPVRQCFRQYPFAALRLGHVGQIRAQLGIDVHLVALAR